MQRIYRTRAGQQVIARWCQDQLDAWQLPHTRQMMAVRGVPTHVITAGEADRTVVFVPGTNFNAATCLPLAAELAAHSRVVVADLPGQPGLSSAERLSRAGGLDWYGRWLTELIDQATEGPVVVLGHSLGAAIALSSDAPRVQRQVLVSPGGLTRLRITPSVALASASWVLQRSPAASERLLRAMHGPGRTPRQPLIDWMTLLAKHVRTSTDPGTAPIASRNVDRQVIIGAHDVFLPPRTLAVAVRSAFGIEPEVLAAAGHLLTEEHPARLVEATLS